MPRNMSAIFPFEIIIQPNVTFILSEYWMPRRIYTDGRARPEIIEPAFAGYSTGKWIDKDGDGRYDELEVETSHFKGPRDFDGDGLPLHADDQTVVKERLFLDKANPGYPPRRDHHHRPRAHAPVDGDEELQARDESDLDRVRLQREQYSCPHWYGELFYWRWRLPDARTQRPEATGHALFPVVAELETGGGSHEMGVATVGATPTRGLRVSNFAQPSGASALF